MSNITIIINKKDAIASTHLPYGAYKHAVALAEAQKATIGRTAENYFRATFAKAKDAKEFKAQFEADYATAHAAYTPKHTEPKAPKTTSKSKPSSSKKTTKKATTSSTKKGKGNSKLTGKLWVKANPSCTREQAAAHGLKGITKLELKALKKELGVR